MWTPEYFVRYVDLPPAVEGVTVPNDDGTFDIYISEHLPPDRREACLRHELRHVRRDHFYSAAPLASQELEAHEPDLPDVFACPDPGTIPYFPDLLSLRGYLESLAGRKTASRQK